MGKVLDKVSPPTDKTCDWDWKTLHCQPRATCKLAYRYGDWHIGRACRLRAEGGHRAPLDAEEEFETWGEGEGEGEDGFDED